MPLIVIEGIDGTGKSTLIANLEGRLKEVGYDVISYREPGGTLHGEEIRRLINLSDNSAEKFFLFLAARAALSREIAKHLEIPKRIVLLDRWSPSTFAYQGQNIPEDVIRPMDELARQGLTYDMVLWLYAPVTVCINRLHGKTGDLGEFEERKTLTYAHQNYAKMFDKDQVDARKWRAIDATQTEDSILAEACNKILVLIATGELTPRSIKRM